MTALAWEWLQVAGAAGFAVVAGLSLARLIRHSPTAPAPRYFPPPRLDIGVLVDHLMAEAEADPDGAADYRDFEVDCGIRFSPETGEWRALFAMTGDTPRVVYCESLAEAGASIRRRATARVSPTGRRERA